MAVLICVAVLAPHNPAPPREGGGVRSGHQGPDGYMKVDELKLELEERGEAKSGNKAWLRRRLHAAILRDYLEGWMDDEAYGF